MTTTAALRAGAHRDLRGLLAGGVVLALAAGAAWWVLTPERFGPAGSRIMAQGNVGQPMLFGTFATPSEAVALRSVTPSVRSNTADADVRVVLCDDARSRSPVGSVIASAEQECARLLSLDGSRLAAGDTRLLLEITPRAVGSVEVQGLDIAYRDGARWGSERAGLFVEVSASS